MTPPSKRQFFVLAFWNLFIRMPKPVRRAVDWCLRADYGRTHG